MTQIKEQIQKYVEERKEPIPPSKPKPKRKSPSFKKTEPIAVRQLYEQHGPAKCGEMLGTSPYGLSAAISRNQVSLTIEKLAEMIILNGGQSVNRVQHHLLICRVPVKQMSVVKAFLDALSIKMRDISE